MRQALGVTGYQCLPSAWDPGRGGADPAGTEVTEKAECWAWELSPKEYDNYLACFVTVIMHSHCRKTLRIEVRKFKLLLTYSEEATWSLKLIWSLQTQNRMTWE